MFWDIVFIFILFVLPVVLIYFKVIPFKYKVRTLALVALVILTIVILQNWDAKKLGIQFQGIKDYVIPYILFTLGLGFALFLISKLSRHSGSQQWWKDSHFLYGFILVSILQEFVFRGFLIPELQSIFSSTALIIFINALLFGFMHIIYSDNASALFMIFLGGVAFASMYIFYPSLIFIAISHAILNFIAVYFGFFKDERQPRLNT